MTPTARDLQDALGDLDEPTLEMLAHGREYDLGRCYERVAEHLREKERKEVFAHPEIVQDGDVRRDFRFRFGVIWGLGALAQVTELAGAILAARRAKEAGK